MQPYMNTLAKSPEYKKITFVKVDMEALPAVAQRCNVKALPTYQLYRSGEKLEEMSGAMPAKLVAMLKTHNVKDKSGPGKLIGLVGAIVLGIFGLLKLKDSIEEWEAEEEERAAILEAEEEARKMAEEEAARARQARLRAQAKAKAQAQAGAAR